MTYDAQESSLEAGQPVELYEFTVNTTVYRYTSNQTDFPIGGFTYLCRSIERSDLQKVPNDPASEEIEVQLPSSDDFVRNYYVIAPGQPVSLKISRVHRNDGANEIQIIFQGTVRNVGYTKGNRSATVYAVPKAAAATRIIPVRVFSTQCNNLVYDDRCKVDVDNPLFMFEGTITSVDTKGTALTVPGAAAFNALTDFFQAGMVRRGDDQRMIISQAGDVVTVNVAFPTTPLGAAVKLNAGCKQRFVTDCASKFSNTDNFGGFPYMPTEDPHRTGIA